MNSKERMLRVLNGEAVDTVPVTPHWWGVYKFQHAGVVHGPEDEAAGWALWGDDLARVDAAFYETFQPDMFHLSAGAWQTLPGDTERQRAHRELRPAVRELTSKRAIDDYIAATTPTVEEFLASGIYAHVPILAETYGERVLILLNEGNPVCEVFENGGPAGDFQDALIATIEQPDNLGYLIYKLYEATLTRMQALKQSGAHGYIGSETCVSPDILSPKTFRAIVYPALKFFYHQIEHMGLIPVTYFLGDILPLVDDIATMGVKALLIEEPKKGFQLDVLTMYRALQGRITVFGNLDSIYHLLMGSTAAIEEETRRQCSCARGGGFVMACGSPLCYDTPPANIAAMMQTAREFAL